MRGFLFSAVLCALIPFSAAAAENEAAGTKAGAETKTVSAEEEKVEQLDSVVVAATRAGKSTPVTYTMVGKEELRKSNPINSLPMNLSLQPSVVTVNEGGTGLGYSKMTVRGSKGSQINVTLNGITLNDAESQEVFWVNIPALSGLISSVQLQRGLGTSANGAGAFGASINMSTASVGSEPYARAEFSAGSYNTLSGVVAAGTGLTKSGFYFDAAYTKGITDGYIRNAWAKVQSAFAVLGWMNENNSLRLTWLMGDQHTGITWNGISLDKYKEDRRYNDTGYMHEDAFGNPCYYSNDSDNYMQNHIQLNYTHQFQGSLVWSTTFNYTCGYGYYENYKDGRKFSKYNMPAAPMLDPETGNQMTDPDSGQPSYYGTGDFIVREILDNHYFVLNSDVKYVSDRLNLTGGVNLSRYDGDHVGHVLWNDAWGDAFDYSSFNSAHEWYLNRGLKHEANVFARAEYTPLPWLTAYADLQYRGVLLNMSGPEDDGILLDYSTAWHFFNPRVGMSFHWNPRNKAYFSASLGNREPGRSDIKDQILTSNAAVAAGEPDPGVTIRPEKMVDVEIGYVYTAPKVTASANLYFMEYRDMLLETGKLTDSGYAIKENVDRSWRRGVELAVAWQALPWLKADANATLSMNEIRDYTAYCDKIRYVSDGEGGFYMDYPGGQEAVHFGKTVMLMSPSVVGMMQLSFTPFRNIARNSLKTTTLAVNGKYVGKQYLDNLSDESKVVPAYFVSNLSLTHEFNVGGGRIGIGGYVSNLFNNLYYADGGAYNMFNVVTKEVESDVWVYPQAPINFMFKISYVF